MGLEKMILVGSRCQIGFEAQQAAATGQSPLQNRVEYVSWNAFYQSEPDSLRIAFSAKSGKLRPLFEAREWLKKTKSDWVQNKIPVPKTVHLIFGTEDTGLSNDDIEFVHANLLLPLYGQNPSLNLAMAVLIAGLLIQEEWGDLKKTVPPHQIPPREVSDHGYCPPQRISNTLRLFVQALGFDISNRRVNAFTVLQRILFHSMPSQKELRALEVVFEQAHRKLTQQSPCQDSPTSRPFYEQQKR